MRPPRRPPRAAALPGGTWMPEAAPAGDEAQLATSALCFPPEGRVAEGKPLLATRPPPSHTGPMNAKSLDGGDERTTSDELVASLNLDHPDSAVDVALPTKRGDRCEEPNAGLVERPSVSKPSDRVGLLVRSGQLLGGSRRRSLRRANAAIVALEWKILFHDGAPGRGDRPRRGQGQSVVRFYETGMSQAEEHGRCLRPAGRQRAEDRLASGARKGGRSHLHGVPRRSGVHRNRSEALGRDGA